MHVLYTILVIVTLHGFFT